MTTTFKGEPIMLAGQFLKPGDSAPEFYLVKNDLGAWYDYTFGPLLFVVCFMMMQKTLTLMIGIRYRDLPKMMKQNLKN